MNQDTVTRIINQQAKDQGYYQSGDIIKAQDSIADDIILENLPVGITMPNFDSYLDKINYIVACGYKVTA